MDIDEQLIEEVRSREILYDLAQADYKNIKKKEYEWREVAAAMKMGEEEYRKRWKGLRDSYKRCKRAEQIPSGSAAKKPRKCWKYFEAMSFLDNVTSSRHTIGNTRRSSSEEYIVDTLDDSSDDVSPSSVCSTSIRETKKSDSRNFQQFLEFAASSIADTCGGVTNTPKKPEDATDLFFAGLAAKVKAANMPPSVLNRLEAKLAACVFAEIDHHFSQQQ